MLKKIQHYISEADLFLAQFDQHQTKLTASQHAEIKKHQKIADQRDKAVKKNSTDSLWEKF